MALQDLKPGWMRQIIGASPRRDPHAPRECVGHFFDHINKRFITVKLGPVYCRPVPTFRATPSEDEPANLLWWAAQVEEGVAPSADNNPAIERGFRSINPSFHSTKKESGSVVIPGLSAMDGASC